KGDPQLPGGNQNDQHPEIQNAAGKKRDHLKRSNTMRSTSESRQNRAKEMIPVSSTALQSSGIWKFCIAVTINRPSPRGAPNHSPRIAPIKLVGTASFMPVAM